MDYREYGNIMRESNTYLQDEFSNSFSIEELQKIQDLFSAATGVASIITDPDGTPITKPSGFCRLCIEIRKTEKGFINCKNSDSIISRLNKDGPNIHKCLSAGLMDAGVKIIIEGKYIGNWMIGQVLDQEHQLEDLENYADSIGLEKGFFLREVSKVKRMSKSEFQNISNFLYKITQLLSKYAMENIKLSNKVRQKEKEINKFVSISSDLFNITDREGNFYLSNKAWQDILGYTEQDLKKMIYQDYIHPEDMDEYHRVVEQINDTGKNIGFTPRLKHKDGSYRYIEWSCIKDGNYYYSADRDVTEYILNKNKIRESEEKFRTIFEQSPIGIALIDTKTHKICDANSKFMEITKRSIKEINRIGWQNITHPDDINIVQWEFLEKGEISKYNVNKRYILPDGSCIWVNLIISKEIVSDTDLKIYVVMVEDITERKIATEKIIYYSYHDQLTGAYNRRFYEEEIKRLDSEENLPISIIIGDVNGLKLINDAFGHSQGDALLKRAAEIIRMESSATDIVLRWGGDEFVVILPSTTTEEAKNKVDRIRKLCLREFINDINLSISFGVDTKNNQNEDIKEVMKKAEDYMYRNKTIESEGFRGSSITTIIHALHEKNPREEMHSKRVSTLCQNIGEALGLSEFEVSKLKMVGLLHDIGKIAIKENILDKPRSLTSNEYEEIKKHSEIGYRILSSSIDMSELAEITLCHHERWDGKGYPKGLKGDEIPLLSRIISIADSYDAMTSDRPYRKAMTKEKAIKRILENSGSQFDSKISKAFVEVVAPSF